MTCFQQNHEEIVNLFFCALQDDASGSLCDELFDEMIEEGVEKETLLKGRQDAYALFSKH